MNEKRDRAIEEIDDLEEETTAKPAKSGGQKIRRKPASKRSPVNEFHARLFALLIDTLEAAALRRFQSPSRERLPVERHEEFAALPEYRLFIEGAYACAFVCTDLAPGGQRLIATPIPMRPSRHGPFRSFVISPIRSCAQSAGRTVIQAPSSMLSLAASCRPSANGCSATMRSLNSIKSNQ